MTSGKGFQELSMVPGPTAVPREIRDLYTCQWPSPDLDPGFLETYRKTASSLGALMGLDPGSCVLPTDPFQVVILSGEGMAALWGAVKSLISPGDRVLAIDNGIFGGGIGQMAATCGAEVRFLSSDYSCAPDLSRLEETVSEFNPMLVTAVHCETPTGVLNPLAQMAGALRARGWEGLFCVDAVASIGSTALETASWQIDLCLGGSQKVLSCPPDTCFLSVSRRAWKKIAARNYQGYDALLPFREASATGYFPYTHNWAGVAALGLAAENLLKEGLEAAFDRHGSCAELTLRLARELGLEPFAHSSVAAPGVTALRVPHEVEWEELNAALLDRGVVLGGSYGDLAGKVFRIGHMGSQARLDLVQRTMDQLGLALLDLDESAGMEP